MVTKRNRVVAPLEVGERLKVSTDSGGTFTGEVARVHPLYVEIRPDSAAVRQFLGGPDATYKLGSAHWATSLAPAAASVDIIGGMLAGQSRVVVTTTTGTLRVDQGESQMSINGRAWHDYHHLAPYVDEDTGRQSLLIDWTGRGENVTITDPVIAIGAWLDDPADVPVMRRAKQLWCTYCGGMTNTLPSRPGQVGGPVVCSRCAYPYRCQRCGYYKVDAAGVCQRSAVTGTGHQEETQ